MCFLHPLPLKAKQPSLGAGQFWRSLYYALFDSCLIAFSSYRTGDRLSFKRPTPGGKTGSCVFQFQGSHGASEHGQICGVSDTAAKKGGGISPSSFFRQYKRFLFFRPALLSL